MCWTNAASLALPANAANAATPSAPPVAGGDGRHHPGHTPDTLSAPGKGTGYRITTDGADALMKLGLQEALLDTASPLRYCVDWTEQAHHLSGPLGAAVTDRLFALEWITRGVVPRSIQVTAEGEPGIAELLAAAQPEAVAAR